MGILQRLLLSIPPRRNERTGGWQRMGNVKAILQTDGSAVDKEEEAMAEEMFETEARTTRNYW